MLNIIYFFFYFSPLSWCKKGINENSIKIFLSSQGVVSYETVRFFFFRHCPRYFFQQLLSIPSVISPEKEMQCLCLQQGERVSLPIAKLLKRVLDLKMQKTKKKKNCSLFFFSSIPVSSFLSWVSLESSCQNFHGKEWNHQPFQKSRTTFSLMKWGQGMLNHLQSFTLLS